MQYVRAHIAMITVIPCEFAIAAGYLLKPDSRREDLSAPPAVRRVAFVATNSDATICRSMESGRALVKT
eukprot:6200809-Pleurochrysis_carterae.AAC.1